MPKQIIVKMIAKILNIFSRTEKLDCKQRGFLLFFSGTLSKDFWEDLLVYNNMAYFILKIVYNSYF